MLIPNRSQMDLDAVEEMAEKGTRFRPFDAARETGNRSSLRVLQAMAIDADKRRR